MKSANNFLITFFSTHQALKAEKRLKSKIEKMDLIPTPREISSECGFSVLITDYTDDLKLLLSTLTYEHRYLIKEHEEGGKCYEKID